ncbi:hypothetical protein [Marinobacterium aestuariivivens]|uniref:Uncharacterized protein n=1 Tax=Marinobacterium aestuariivivens TaxID=1698799 RepID=A0ABW2A9V4_9GAMM
MVWFSDLRDSTSISESMPRVRYLELLNAFFDCMAGAVMEQGAKY